MRFFMGHAGVVRTTRMPIVCGSMTATSWIILSSIMGRPSSGSLTGASTARTSASDTCVTAIASSLPRASDVTEDDVVDQALHRGQVIGKDDAVRRHAPEVAGGERVANDRLQLGVPLRPGPSQEAVDRGWRRGRVDHGIREALI